MSSFDQSLTLHGSSVNVDLVEAAAARAASGRSNVHPSPSPSPFLSLAAQVCAVCKARKKKCNKALPRCDFCVRKGLGCGYNDDSPSPTPTPPRAHDRDVPSRFPLPFAPLRVPVHTEAHVYLQVQSCIRSAGLFVDDVSVRYFQGVHRYLPIISRTRFHTDLITLGATPSAGFSALLLAMCLTSTCPAWQRRAEHEHEQGPGPGPHKTPHIDHGSLYLTTTSLLAQIQALFPPSIYLVQAGLLLAVYEYVSGRPDKAFASIVACARMAYTARMHKCNLPSSHPPATDRAYQLQVQEAANTWWGIVICERTFFCDVAVTEQPLVTIIPGGHASLPVDLGNVEQIDFRAVESVPYVPVSYLSSVHVESFGRAAQAAWLLDQVIKAFDIPTIDTRLFQLDGLDNALQSFLGVLMQQSNGGRKIFCEAIAITIRALFMLHWHILDLISGLVGVKYKALQDGCKSHAALHTTTNLVLDVVEAHENENTSPTSYVAPSYPYLIRAALKYIYKKAEWEEDSWLRSAEERFRTSLNGFPHHHEGNIL